MIKKILLLFFCIGSLSAQEPVDFVCPFVGTQNYGTTNPGALRPNGLMSVCPFNVMGSDLNRYDKDRGWWSAPYDHRNSYFTGYSHVNLSGVGCPDLSTLLVMPTTGTLDVDYRNYGSTYRDETAIPGYYSNYLEKYGIRTEVTATARCAIERFTFPNGKGHLLLNLGEGLTNESGAWVRRVNDCEIEGMKLLGTFCYTQQAVFPIYFVLRVSQQPDSCGFWKKQRERQGTKKTWDYYAGRYKLYPTLRKELAGDDIGYWFNFDTQSDRPIEVRMGVSFVSTENARANLEAETTGRTFEEVKASARKEWNDALSRILVSGGSDERKKVFYTALYHSLIHPNILSDVNGQYPRMEVGETGIVKKGMRYTVFSLWDTYRTLHPLLTLVYPERQLDMVRSMVGMAEESGWMPRWELYGRETFTMEGDPAIPVIADTWLKGLRDFDIESAYKAFRRSATAPGAENKLRRDADPYIERGYIPVGYYEQDLSGDNSVSHTLEYCQADWALSQLAKALGQKEDAALFLKQSQGYRKYFDKTNLSLRPRMKDGSWYAPFNPQKGKNFEVVPGFHEGSAWNYTFSTPFDVAGLVKLMGGKKNYVNLLQKVFDDDWYDPTNEPGIVYPYLFSRFKGEAWRTQREVNRLLEKHFSSRPEGLPGNDDTGTLSAWAVWSLMGIYPDCPADPAYTLSTPGFERIEIQLDKQHYPNERLLITTEGKGIYIRSIMLDGKPFSRYRINHNDLMRAHELHFELSEQPLK